MRSVIKVINMNTSEDVSNINLAVSNNQGVIACQINSKTKEIEIIYDDYFITVDNLIESVEEAGYAVI